MDPERQPLLSPVRHRTELGQCSRFRPLTQEEVLRTRQDITWNRTRFCILFLFWGLMAMFLSIVACLLITSPRCSDSGLGPMPAVPPVHMSLAPLISISRTEEPAYTL